MRERVRTATVLLAVVGFAPAHAGETKAGFGVGVIAGYDSNPMRVSNDGPNGTFTRLSLDGNVLTALNNTAGLFASGNVHGRFHDSDTSHAETTDGGVRAGLTISPLRFHRRLLVSSGARYALYRGTFVDRGSGLVYEASVEPATDPPSTVPIPDRLDYDMTGVFLHTRWRQNQKLRLFLETALDRTDYVEDYATSTGLDSLDHESLTLKPGATFRIGDAVSMTLSVALTDLQYDDRPARDGAGAEVPGTRREYRYTQYQVSVKASPSARWSLWGGATGIGRDDTYEGYYDYTTRAAYFAVERDLGAKSGLRLTTSMRDVEYDQATVTGLPDGEINESEAQRFAGRFHRRAGDRIRWFVEAGTEQTDSRDPVFTHDRDWFHVGFEFRR